MCRDMPTKRTTPRATACAPEARKRNQKTLKGAPIRSDGVGGVRQRIGPNSKEDEADAMSEGESGFVRCRWSDGVVWQSEEPNLSLQHMRPASGSARPQEKKKTKKKLPWPKVPKVQKIFEREHRASTCECST